MENTYLPPNELPPVPVIDSYNGGLLYSAFTSLTRVPDGARYNFMGNDYLSTDDYPQEFFFARRPAGQAVELKPSSATSRRCSGGCSPEG